MRRSRLVAIPLAAQLTACAHGKHFQAHRSNRQTCLVLSVGGPGGVAHLGAIEATRDAGLEIDCVTGNSMGSLVGSLYATAPEADTTDRFKSYLASYTAATKDDAVGSGLIGALLLGGLVVMSGGAVLPAVAGAAVGGAAGASSVNTVDLERTAKVLDQYYANASIEGLPVAYRTWFHEMSEQGVELKTADSGNLASAVKKSIANPLIFKGLNPVQEGFVDPGVDRISAVPVEDTCAEFPRAQLLVINTTGRPAKYDDDIGCPVLEVTVDVGTVDPAAVLELGPTFEKVVAKGYTKTAAALRH